MSKDIIRVHATIWPAMLLSLDLPLPKQLFVHGYFLIDGQKMSKSIGNVIAPADLVKNYGVDATRYLLMSATGFGSDGDISWKWFDEKYNSDLANGLGNLLARSITLAERTQNAKIKMQNDNAKLENWGGHDFVHEVEATWEAYGASMNTLKIDRALNLTIGDVQNGAGMVRFLDRYITTVKPWELMKNNDEKIGIVMYNILERLRQIAWMVWPFMPETAEKIWSSLGLDSSVELKKDYDDAIKWGGLPVDTKVKKGDSLFPRI